VICVCTECNEGPCVRNCRKTPPVFHEYIPGDTLYSDPMGEPYQGLETFIQTPMTNPIRPHTSEEVRILKEEKIKRSTTKLIDSM